eukprot:CAMPEP_0194534866 /NCGR_PEP_ID=MMETSP0253-20130528/73223_1 /TAXON_ID=2966 /ORGANISM="Noctiluca scintillans" /LENGTH=556 /DNA_ID=CAMNT_0039380573 /DNA_START=118 /DNA_END=1785 /DNA_ORIENTATION=+
MQLQTLVWADIVYCFGLCLATFWPGSPLQFVVFTGQAVSVLVQVFIAITITFEGLVQTRGLSGGTATLVAAWVLGMLMAFWQTWRSLHATHDNFYCKFGETSLSATWLIGGFIANVILYLSLIVRYNVSRVAVVRLLVFVLSFLVPYTLRLFFDFAFLDVREKHENGMALLCMTCNVLEILKGFFDVVSYLVIGRLARLSFRTTVRHIEMEPWTKPWSPTRHNCCRGCANMWHRAVMHMICAMECDVLEDDLHSQTFMSPSLISFTDSMPSTPGTPKNQPPALMFDSQMSHPDEKVTFNGLFKVDEFLGDESCGRVEKALARKRYNKIVENKWYAVTILEPGRTESEDRAMHEERDILMTLQHCGVAHLVASLQWVWCGLTHRALVLEYCSGGDLEERVYNLKPAVLDEAKMVRYTAEILDALDYIHSLGFFHKGLSLSNVLLTASDHCKLADFCLVKRMLGATWDMSEPYAAPEIRAHQSPSLHSAAADIYSFGIVVLHMAGGDHPSRSTRHRRFSPDAPPHTEQFLKSTTAEDPKERANACKLRSSPFFQTVNW